VFAVKAKAAYFSGGEQLLFSPLPPNYSNWSDKAREVPSSEGPRSYTRWPNLSNFTQKIEKIYFLFNLTCKMKTSEIFQESGTGIVKVV